MSLQLIIMRGLPGSGKSSLAKAILENSRSVSSTGIILSTDDYFETPQGYVFVARQIGIAHAWNQHRAFQAMRMGLTPIIIDNTNTQRWEARPYVEAGLAHKYTIEIVEPTTPWCKSPTELAYRNTHSVSLVVIENMLKRWEDEFTVESILCSVNPDHK
eukprot:jgi/Hompol1/1376/HPOL_005584-RA